ncbi:hypothetical protein OPT61_g885 [Boeremia exigua]|uniref:Uncharacterized protein n=1 Tax=Boeremia exigua TaxID=749465 RepID=A0ACC2ISE0_9PLEO|nr:hypothetical protein OPT61_g885 [Boeremia exigua]
MVTNTQARPTLRPKHQLPYTRRDILASLQRSLTNSGLATGHIFRHIISRAPAKTSLALSSTRHEFNQTLYKALRRLAGRGARDSEQTGEACDGEVRRNGTAAVATERGVEPRGNAVQQAPEDLSGVGGRAAEERGGCVGLPGAADCCDGSEFCAAHCEEGGGGLAVQGEEGERGSGVVTADDARSASTTGLGFSARRDTGALLSPPFTQDTAEGRVKRMAADFDTLVRWREMETRAYTEFQWTGWCSGNDEDNYSSLPPALKHDNAGGKVKNMIADLDNLLLQRETKPSAYTEFDWVSWCNRNEK